MTREERIDLLSRIARGEETEEKVGKEGPSVVAASIKDRLVALRMLGELDGDFERAKRTAATKDDDEFAGMSEAQLRAEIAKRRQLDLPIEESNGN